MKKYKEFFAGIPILVILVSSCFNNVNGQVVGKWTGTVSTHVKYKGITGRSDKYIDISFTDNIGWGTIKYDDELIIEGKSMGKSSCNGTGEVELHAIYLMRSENSYHIETIGPTCSMGSNPWPYHHDNDITISDQQLGENHNLLSGTVTTVAQMPGGIGTVTTTLSWNLRQGPLDAVLIVTPTDYNNWKPDAGRDELIKGNAMDISLRVQGRNGGKSSLKAIRFELSLNGTSKEKGITINYPINPSHDLPDLRFIATGIAESIEPDQYLEINCEDGVNGKAYIGSYDGGGWTDLKVVAILEGGTRIEGHLLTPTGITQIPVPNRNGKSKIASSWLAAYANLAETDDKETSRGNKNNGDGLSAYEEYRGVISKGKFERLFPGKKELGIWMKKDEIVLFDEGLGIFKAASGIETVSFIENEIDADRWLNRNAGHATVYKQYVLKLDTGQTSKHAAGENRPTTLDYMLPYQSKEVVINISYMNTFYPQQAIEAGKMHVAMPYTLKDLINTTVAHEIAHGVNVNHHGDRSKNVIQEREIWEGTGNFHVYNNKPVPQEIPVAQWSFDQTLQKHYYKIFGNTGIPGPPGNEESGDMSCFMCYTSMYNWSFVTGTNGALNYYMVPILPVGKKLCTGTNPTGINTKPWFFGAAMTGRGNCLGQLQLR